MFRSSWHLLGCIPSDYTYLLINPNVSFPKHPPIHSFAKNKSKKVTPTMRQFSPHRYRYRFLQLV